MLRLILLCSILVCSPAQAALETKSSETDSACATLVKVSAQGTSLTSTDPKTGQVVDSPSAAKLIGTCNKNQQMCTPTKKQLAEKAPPGLACAAEAQLGNKARKCLMVLTLLGQWACGEDQEIKGTNVLKEQPVAGAAPIP